MIEHRPRACLPAKSTFVSYLFDCSEPLVSGPILEFSFHRTFIMPRLASLLVLAVILLLGSTVTSRALANQDATKGKPASDADQPDAAASSDDADDAPEATT